MPATWDLPRSSGLWNQQDIANYNRLPIWMAMQQTKKMQMWSRWKDMFPKIKWKQNMGDILQGVIAENSPIVNQVHRPAVPGAGARPGRASVLRGRDDFRLSNPLPGADPRASVLGPRLLRNTHGSR